MGSVFYKHIFNAINRIQKHVKLISIMNLPISTSNSTKQTWCRCSVFHSVVCLCLWQGSDQGVEVVRGPHYWSGPSGTHPTGAEGEMLHTSFLIIKSFLPILPFIMVFRVCHYCPLSSDFLQPQIRFIFVMYGIFNFLGMVRRGPLWLPHHISSHSPCILN